MSDRFVTYFRVSTSKQGQSGLGLEAQKHAIDTFLADKSGTVIGSFTEVESGRNRNRPELAKAFETCEASGATLLIAKLDRLSRNAAFLLTLRDSGVAIKAADMPDADSFMIGIMALLAEKEADMISRRTKEALQAAKRRGVKLGNPNGAKALRDAQKGNQAALQAIQDKSKRHAAQVRSILERKWAESVSDVAQDRRSYRRIADDLNAAGIRTRTGSLWHASSARRMMMLSDDVFSAT